MSVTKHTPGPWCISGESATIVQADHRAINSEGGLLIASAHGYPDSGYMPSDDEAAANARLIAAAPELLEALEKLYALVEGESPSLLDEDSGGDSRLDIEICAAIAKAKGVKP